MKKVKLFPILLIIVLLIGCESIGSGNYSISSTESDHSSTAKAFSSIVVSDILKASSTTNSSAPVVYVPNHPVDIYIALFDSMLNFDLDKYKCLSYFAIDGSTLKNTSTDDMLKITTYYNKKLGIPVYNASLQDLIAQNLASQYGCSHGALLRVGNISNTNSDMIIDWSIYQGDTSGVGFMGEFIKSGENWVLKESHPSWIS